MRADPYLDCPECGEPLIRAHARGRVDHDGNIIEHRNECRCRWCGWMWFDDRTAVVCMCGATVKVVVDESAAHTRTVEASGIDTGNVKGGE